MFGVDDNTLKDKKEAEEEQEKKKKFRRDKDFRKTKKNKKEGEALAAQIKLVAVKLIIVGHSPY